MYKNIMIAVIYCLLMAQVDPGSWIFWLVIMFVVPIVRLDLRGLREIRTWKARTARSLITIAVWLPVIVSAVSVFLGRFGNSPEMADSLHWNAKFMVYGALLGYAIYRIASRTLKRAELAAGAPMVD
jgi:hypothetical protein